MDNTPIVPEENRGSKSTVMIVLGIVGVLCILVLCACAILYGFRSGMPNMPGLATATLFPRPPEVTTYEFFDDFEDNSNQWEVGEVNNEFFSGEVDVQDGTYVWDVKEFHSSEFVSSWRTYADSPVVGDFDMTVDVKLLTPESDQLCYAVVFHANPGNFATHGYEFHVCETGRFFVGYYSDDESESKEILYWTESSAILSGDWNRLAVNARGDNYTLAINNEVVFQFTDTTSSSGRVYLLMRYYESVPGTILFDNFGFQSR